MSVYWYLYSIEGLESEVERLKAEYSNLCLVVDDDLQSLSSEATSINRDTHIGNVMRKLKILAHKNQLAVIACSQLSRDLERRPDKRPMLSDLRDSGAIENEADIVSLFISR